MAKKKAKTEETEPKGIGTKEVAEIVSDAVGRDIDAKALRVYIRDSDLFNGQRSKRYGFEDENDPKIQELIDYIEERGQRKKSEPEDKPAKKKKSGKKSGKKLGKKAKRKLKKKVQEEEEE